MAGLIHIYCGDGKGKTTAALGLALRAAGSGKRVLLLQFFKDGKSSEFMSACATGMIDEGRLLELLRQRPEELEVVMTGRDPSPELLAAADYVTEMCKRKHPFEKGVPARKGIEF